MHRTIARAIAQTFALFLMFEAGVADAQTKVACVGDSITALPSSWCGNLATKLGSGYTVKNFGVSGTNLAKGVSQPYWDSAQYKPSHDFAPNIVIIMLGTNDAFSFSWSGAKTHFVKDYEELLDTYTSLASKPKPYMIIPTPIGTSPFGHDGNLLATEVVPLVKQVAMEKMVPTIDAFTLFGGAMFDTSLFSSSDQVHPNAKGQQMICDEVYKVLMATGALGGAATAGSGATAGTAASAGSGGMAATSATPAKAGNGAAAGAAGTAMPAASVSPTAAGAGAPTVNAGSAGSGVASPPGGAVAGSKAVPVATGAPGAPIAGNSASNVNAVGVAGSAPVATTAPQSSSDGGCRVAAGSTNSGAATAALTLLLGLALRGRRRSKKNVTAVNSAM